MLYCHSEGTGCGLWGPLGAALGRPRSGMLPSGPESVVRVVTLAELEGAAGWAWSSHPRDSGVGEEESV